MNENLRLWSQAGCANSGIWTEIGKTCLSFSGTEEVTTYVPIPLDESKDENLKDQPTKYY